MMFFPAFTPSNPDPLFVPSPLPPPRWRSTSLASMGPMWRLGFSRYQFFDYHGTPDDERLQIASFYLDGAALSWFQWMYQNNQLTTWADFLNALEMRFAPSFYDDPWGAFFKLTQHRSVNSYLSKFENLANRIVCLPPSFLLSCFVSGLTSDIRREV